MANRLLVPELRRALRVARIGIAFSLLSVAAAIAAAFGERWIVFVFDCVLIVNGGVVSAIAYSAVDRLYARWYAAVFE